MNRFSGPELPIAVGGTCRLLPQPSKESDPRAAGFRMRHGKLVQVELDAPPDILRGLFQEAIDEFWDTSAYDAAIRREERDRPQLQQRDLNL